jgi:hypothetical protein
MRAGRDHDLCRGAPLDEHRFTDRRVHCANRKKVKGSTKTNRYFPNDVAGAAVALNDPSVLSSHQIYWDKWMRLQKEAALNDMNSYEMDHEYPDYE